MLQGSAALIGVFLLLIAILGVAMYSSGMLTGAFQAVGDGIPAGCELPSAPNL